MDEPFGLFYKNHAFRFYQFDMQMSIFSILLSIHFNIQTINHLCRFTVGTFSLLESPKTPYYLSFKNLWKNDGIPFSEKSLMYKNIFLSRAIHNILQNPLHTLIWYTVLFTFTYIQAIISLKRKVLTNKKICFIAQHRDIPRNLFSL